MQLRNLLEAKKFHRIPLQKMATGHYACHVILNGQKGIFIVDTGASSSCIGLEYVTLFQLKQEESDVMAAGAGSSNMKTALSSCNTLEIQKHSAKNMTFVLFDLSHVNNALAQVNAITVHGILGADYLKKYRAVIDYGRNCMFVK